MGEQLIEKNPMWNKLRTGEVDANNQTQFFSILLKGLIYDLNGKIRIRNNSVPHFILNTGDDIMYLEKKEQDMSVEPLEVSNEGYIYSKTPRSMVTPGGISINSDQLTNPHILGRFDFEWEDSVYSFVSEFRRLPLTISIGLEYVADSYTDILNISQQILAKLVYINSFNISYLGQNILCSYNLPDAYENEFQMEFDGMTSESKLRKLSVDIDLQTNFPVLYSNTIIPADAYIKGIKSEINPVNKGTL